MEREQAAELVSLQREALAALRARTRSTRWTRPTPRTRCSRRSGQLGVEEPWRQAEPLAAAGARPRLARPGRARSPDRRPRRRSRWIAASLTRAGAGRRADATSTEQMSRLVGAVKTYAYMDRGELNEVDVHEGLETTLTVLGHKLKHTDDRRSCATTTATLPQITVHGAELNQVWTNLLDNAIGALGEAGTITVTTRRDGDCAEIEIADDGPGIPAEIRDACSTRSSRPRNPGWAASNSMIQFCFAPIGRVSPGRPSTCWSGSRIYAARPARFESGTPSLHVPAAMEKKKKRKTGGGGGGGESRPPPAQ